MIRPPPSSPLFPYTTLFRSVRIAHRCPRRQARLEHVRRLGAEPRGLPQHDVGQLADLDRKSTRLNSSHMSISYAVFCLKKKKKKNENQRTAGIMYIAQGDLR